MEKTIVEYKWVNNKIEDKKAWRKELINTLQDRFCLYHSENTRPVSPEISLLVEEPLITF